MSLKEIDNTEVSIAKEYQDSISNESFSQYPCTIVINVDNGKQENVIKFWNDKEERKVERRIDFLVMPLLLFAFFILQMDRGNISNALTSTLSEDIGLDNNKINVGTALFNVGIVIFEIPSNILLQKFGPSRWLSFQILIWSLCATLQSCITNYKSFLVTRFLMGALEAGYIPGGLYYISTWYTRKQLTTRYSLFFIGNLSASATSSLIASGILKNVAGSYGLAGWKWIFIIEGVMGIGYGLIFAFLIPNSPVDPTPFWRGFRLFSERESSIIRGRVLLDDPEKLNNSENISLTDIKETLSQWRLWLHFIFTLSYMQSTQALSTYVPSIVKTLGYSSVSANAMSSIGSWCSVVFLVVLTLLSHQFKVQSIPIIFLSIWQLIFTICLFAISNSDRKNLKFALLTCLTTGGSIGHVLNCSWASKNARKPVQRSIAMAILVMAANIAGICAGQILRTNDEPKYHKAFLALMIVSIFTLLISLLLSGQYIWSNKKLDNRFSLSNSQTEVDNEICYENNDNQIILIGKIKNDSKADTILDGLNTSSYKIRKNDLDTFINEEKFRYQI